MKATSHFVLLVFGASIAVGEPGDAYVATTNMVAIGSDLCGVEQLENWGFGRNITELPAFTNATSAISNGWNMADAEFLSIMTNRVPRVFFSTLAGFSGPDAYLGIWGRMLDLHSADSNVCSAATIQEYGFGTQTPMEGYAVLHYADPTVSNLLQRTLILNPTDPDWSAYYLRVLSGEAADAWEEECELGLHCLEW